MLVHKELDRLGVEFLRFEMPDLMGIPRSKTVPAGSVERFATKGVNMYGGTLGLDTQSKVVPNTLIGEENGYRDAFLIPDPDTFCQLAWNPSEACVICTPCCGDERTPMTVAPRTVLQAQLAKARKLGFNVISGHELEFYLLSADTCAPLFDGHHIFMSGRNHYTHFISELLRQLLRMGFDLTTHNAEYAPSQFEINFAPSEGVRAADQAFRFKSVVKEFARSRGFLATFMSKPASNLAGCGYHLHLGLNFAENGQNAFNDPTRPAGLSQIALQFTAGILRHARALTALMAPTINCYHRFVRGSFAPSRVTWGIEDRTALLRMKASRNSATHLEMRGGAGMANPYLLQAGILAAGLLGIAEGAEPQVPQHGLAEDDVEAPTLPSSLEQALAMLNADHAFCESLGPDFVRLFTTVKEHEINRWRQHISDWEIAEYREIY